MIKSFFSILIILFLSTINTTLANENIVFLDMDYVLTNSNKGKLILSELEILNKENIKKIKSMEELIKSEEQKIINQKNIISDEIYSQKIDNLKQKIKVFRNDKNNLVKNFQNVRETKINNFLKIINEILADYVNKNSIDLVLNKKDILIGKNDYNITDEILEIVNKL